MPIGTMLLGFIIPYLFLLGVFEHWHYIGNPSEKIIEIKDLYMGTVYIETENDSLYSLDLDYFLRTESPYWESLESLDVQKYGIYEFRDDFVVLPPLFKVKQYSYSERHETETRWGYKVALTSKGDLWVWSHSLGSYSGFLLIIFPVVGLITGGLLSLVVLIFNFVRRKLKNKQGLSNPSSNT